MVSGTRALPKFIVLEINRGSRAVAQKALIKAGIKALRLGFELGRGGMDVEEEGEISPYV